MINAGQLMRIMPFAASRVATYAPLLSDTMDEFEIDTPKRQAAFLAQVAHESGQLRYTEEIASGEAYEGRSDLGNVHPGDGKQFKGRGLIQLTGRRNYRDCSLALGVDLIKEPQLLSQPQLATRSAGWFWRSKNLNKFADSNQFGSLTKAINGGYNGLDDRIQLWIEARRTLGV